MAEVGIITLRVVREANEELKRELARVNDELSKAWDENAELRARDANAYMKAVVGTELREAESRRSQAEQRAKTAERKLAQALGKLDRIQRTVSEPVR